VFPDLSVIVPVYNEDANVSATVYAADSILRDFVERLEWVLVDDGSQDSTWKKLQEIKDSLPNVKILRHEANKGLGAAIWTGMAQASATWCTWLPADGQIDARSVAEMLKHGGNIADVVILVRNEKARHWWRQLLSFGVFGLMRLLSGSDVSGFSGVYLAQKKYIHTINFYGATAVQNYAIMLHSQKTGKRIKEIPTILHPRLSGVSKVSNLSTIMKTFVEIMKLSARINRDIAPSQ